MALRDFLAEGEPDTRTCVFLSAMKPFKYAKDLLMISGVNSNSIVGYRELPDIALARYPNMHTR